MHWPHWRGFLGFRSSLFIIRFLLFFARNPCYANVYATFVGKGVPGFPLFGKFRIRKETNAHQPETHPTARNCFLCAFFLDVTSSAKKILFQNFSEHLELFFHQIFHGVPPNPGYQSEDFSSHNFTRSCKTTRCTIFGILFSRQFISVSQRTIFTRKEFEGKKNRNLFNLLRKNRVPLTRIRGLDTSRAPKWLNRKIEARKTHYALNRVKSVQICVLTYRWKHVINEIRSEAWEIKYEREKERERVLRNENSTFSKMVNFFWKVKYLAYLWEDYAWAGPNSFRIARSNTWLSKLRRELREEYNALRK